MALRVGRHPGLEQLEHERDLPWTLSWPRSEPLGATLDVTLFLNDADQLYALGTVERGSITTALDRRLKITAFERLSAPVPATELLELLPSRVRHHADLVMNTEGEFPSATWRDLGRVLASHGLTAPVFDVLSSNVPAPTWLTSARGEQLALERDHMELATRLAGIEPRDRPAWHATAEPAPFLAGLEGIVASEDNMLQHDLHVLAGFELVDSNDIAATAEFSDGRTRVTAVNVNRRRAETSLGADLIYYSHEHRSYLVIQYKRMVDRVTIGQREEPIFRPASDAHITKQVTALNGLAASLPASDPDEYRLGGCAGFVKLCQPQVNLAQSGMLPGLYIPSDYWPLLIAAPSSRGPKGGVGIGYHNTPRRLTNTLLVESFRAGLIGTNGPASSRVETVLRSSINAGHTITIAVAELEQ